MTIEEQIVVKFYIKLGKTATATYNLLNKRALTTNVYRVHQSTWLKRFQDGREDDSRPDHPSRQKWMTVSKNRQVI